MIGSFECTSYRLLYSIDSALADEGEPFVRDATWRDIEYVHVDAMSALVRCADRVEK